MGARGPKPLPSNVHVFRGNPGHKAGRQLDQGPQPDVEIPGCPAHLLPEARKEWRRIAPELGKLGLISKLDRAALAMYCQEYAWLVWHEKALRDDIEAVAEKRQAFEADPANAGKPWTGGDGFMVNTPSGGTVYNGHWVARNRHSAMLDRLLANFGLSPSSRGRVTPSSVQPELPGIPPKEGFGAL